jgi:hypothetical protein
VQLKVDSPTHSRTHSRTQPTTVPVLYLTELRDYLHRQEQQVLAPEDCRDIAACLAQFVPA